MGNELKSHPAILGVFASRVKLEQRDDGLWGLCPFHPDKNPSLVISKDEKQEWVFWCFGCSCGGDAIKFVQDFDKVSFKEATKVIEDACGGNWEENKARVDNVFTSLEFAKSEEKTYTLQEYAKLEVGLYNSAEAQEWLFTQRGITYDTAKKLHFGYKQDLPWVELMVDKYPNLKGLHDKGWIALPCFKDSRVVSIEYRSLAKKEFVRQKGMDGSALSGIESISTEEPIYVVEGKFDRAVMEQAGYRAVSLPSASSKLTPEMRDQIMSASVVILAGDNDGSVGTAKMLKLWKEFSERTFMLTWGNGKKDANQTFLEVAGRDISAFRKIVDGLTLEAYSKPMPGVLSIQEILRSDQSGNMLDRPDRFHFPWKSVDRMVCLLPGTVTYWSATVTSCGKSTSLLQATLAAAKNNDEVVLNYQCEMGPEEIGNIVAAQTLAKDRNTITKEDRLETSKRLKNAQYYIGSDPNLNKMEDVLDLIESGVRRLGATVVILDHIHFVCRNSSNEVVTQANAMQRIKRMAQQYFLKFFVVGQPRKPPANNKSKEQEFDVYSSKGSETLSSDADAVFIWHRDQLKNFDKDDPPMDLMSPEVQVRCMKGRSRAGGGAFTKLYFLGKIATFTEIVKEPEIPLDNRFDF